MPETVSCRKYQSRSVCYRLLLVCLICWSVPAEAQRGPAPVVVAEVLEQDQASGQVFVATVTPSRRAAVGSAVDGRVFNYPINEGDFVQAKAPLAELLTETIKLEIEAAEHELELRQHEYDELKNGSRKEEIEQSQAAMLAAAAVQEYESKRLTRAEDLYQRGAVNPEELQQIVSQKLKAEQDYLQAKAHYELTLIGPRAERISQAEARVGIQKATVEKLRDQLGKHTMRAPFAGYIAAEHTEQGQWVQRGELVAEVIALDEVDLLAYVPEQSIRFVQPGQVVNVEIPALPDQLFTGTVMLIIPQADVLARTFPVKVRIKNTINDEGPLLKSGMMARVTLPTGQPQKSIIVPKDAIVLGRGQKMVYVVTPAGDKGLTVRPVPVNIGINSEQGIAVTGELKPGDQVVIRGNDRLQPNQPIVIAP